MEKEAAMAFLRGMGKAVLPSVGGWWNRMKQGYGLTSRLFGHATKGLSKGKYGTGMVEHGSRAMQSGARGVEQYGKYAQGLSGAELAGYKIARPTMAVGVGLPLALAPFTAAGHLGAATMDKDQLKARGMMAAQDQLSNRMAQMQELSLRDRMHFARNPLEYSNYLVSNPGTAQTYNALNGGGSGFGLGSAYGLVNPMARMLGGESPYSAIARAAATRAMNKPASEKPSLSHSDMLKMAFFPQALNIGKNIWPAAAKLFNPIRAGAGNMWKSLSGSAFGKGLGKTWQNISQGYGSGKDYRLTNKALRATNKALTAGQKANMPANDIQQLKGVIGGYEQKLKGLDETLGQLRSSQGFGDLMGQFGTMVGRRPVATSIGTAGTAAMPFFLSGSFNQGRTDAREAATQVGQEMVDANLAQYYANMPAWQRYGAALAPGMASRYVNNQAAQLLNPHYRNF